MSTATSIRIRPFTQADYAGAIETNNAVYSDYPNAVEEWQHQDANRDPKIKHARFVAVMPLSAQAVLEGKIVGVGQYGQSMTNYHPRKFWLETYVHPDHQGQGIGSALYDTLMEALQPLEPLALRYGAREDMQRSLRFLQDRGFQEERRAWESRLDVQAFDPVPYLPLLEQLGREGIEIKSIRELEADPERDHKLYQVELAAEADMPGSEPFTEYDFEHFRKSFLNNPDLSPDSWLVALKDGEYLAVSTLWKAQASPDLYNGATGTRQQWRRRGLALALKVKNILWAKAQGYKQIKTWNDSINRPMLSINERLGFWKMPAWITYLKEFGE